MKRRQFNRHLIDLAAATASVSLLSQCSGETPRKNARYDTASPRTGGQPIAIASTEGLLALSLTATSQTQTIAGKPLNLLAYNGQVPGPVLEVRTGDVVRLTLVNHLSSPTNLHYHGLHISPEVDDVFREVAAGERYTYEFQIPKTHPAVTGWYHPHYHLQVASQVFDGLAGPLIVRGALDDIPEIRQAAEALLVLKDFEPKLQGGSQNLSTLAKRWGREGRLLTANGQQNPMVKLPHNGLLRLRLINASASGVYQLRLPDHPWFLIATDRGAIAEPIELETLLLSPGERAELLIPGSREPGNYEIVSVPYDRGLSEMIESMGEAARQMPGIVLPKHATIATLQYQPSDRKAPLLLPQQLIPVEPLPEPEIHREFVLDHGIDRSAGSTGFTINGQSFVMGRVNTHVRLNQVEDWHIINRASMAHPFHLHTNRFQVIERNGQPEPFRAWKDTVAIGSYESVTLRIKFEDFAGQTVYHCHILDHEDQGMMGIVDIQT
ncbi:MAG: multicopper oxidase family protein [Phormidesmis sp. RL_2_1]|nr:multicopper oxidase family protein [Phormidesmis sp. RL_2_1]